MTLRARRILLAAALAWLAFALFVLLLSPLSVFGLQERLETSAAAALAQREHNWAHVDVRGQVAVLSGAAPSAAARDDARRTVLRSTWSGGVVAGGISRVRDETTQAREETGFAFRADLLNGRVLIRGDATDAASRDAIAEFARATFPAGADADLTLIPGGAPSAEWEDAAKRLLGQLARLDRGAIVLDGQQGGIIGQAANPQVAQSVATALSLLPEPYRAAIAVTPAGGVQLAEIPDAAACEAVVGAALGWNALRFDQGSAAPSPLSELALRRVGEVFSACGGETRLNVLIRRVDSQNDLAQERAQTVQTLLEAGGADADRLLISFDADLNAAIGFSVSSMEG